MASSPAPVRERLSPLEAEQLAWRLGGDVAFLRAQQGVYFAHRPPGLPFSPVLRLLRGIHELEPQRARWIVRHPVYATAAATAGAAGAVKVAGRVLHAGLAARDHGLPPDGAPLIDAGAALPRPQRASAGLEPALGMLVGDVPGPADDTTLAALAVRLARAVLDLAPEGARWDRPVAALLVDAAGTVLDWATNTGSSNTTGHAELNLLERAAERWGGLPGGTRVVTSLKPCKMCAGVLWDTCGDRNSLRVLYVEDDPGRGARETVLEPGTMARRTFGAASERFLAPLQRITPPAERAGISRA